MRRESPLCPAKPPLKHRAAEVCFAEQPTSVHNAANVSSEPNLTMTCALRKPVRRQGASSYKQNCTRHFLKDIIEPMRRGGIKEIIEFSGQMIGYLVLFLVFLPFIVLGLISLPFVYLWTVIRNALGLGSVSVSPDALDEYHGLMEALRLGEISFLESYKASMPCFPDCTDHVIGRQWLINAIDVGALISVQWVLDQGVEIEFYDDEGYSPLTSAIEKEYPDNVELVTMLLDQGVNVNAKGTLDKTPLHVAAVRGTEAVVRLLLDQGADPLAFDAEYSPMPPINYVDPKKGNEISSILRAAMETARKTH